MTESIRPYIPFMLVYKEEFNTRIEAISREKYLVKSKIPLGYSLSGFFFVEIFGNGTRFFHWLNLPWTFLYNRTGNDNKRSV